MNRYFLVLTLLCGCSPSTLPPFAEAIVSVDVDVPGPRVVSRLRVDIFDANGVWLESRDIARPDPRDWPASFSVFSSDEERSVGAWLRIRVYPEGAVRDYQGERFWDNIGPYFEPPPTDGLPRLIRQGEDVTPETEPLPLVTIDRLVALQLVPGQVDTIPIVMHAACAGTMAKLSNGGGGLVPQEATSCVDVEKQRVVLEPPAPGDVLASQQLNHERDCGASIPDTTCIAGAATILGSAELVLISDRTSIPERSVVISPFVADTTEVTVGRFRLALNGGFLPPTMPETNNNPLGSTVQTTCTYSDNDIGRENYALSCIDWFSARALCQHFGGDLPTEAQWEHMARTRANGRTRYPWGDAEPSCNHAIHGRMTLGGLPGVCEHIGTQPLPVGAAPLDITPAGVIDLGGGVGEWVLDEYVDYSDACWVAGSVFDPTCQPANVGMRGTRGGNWLAPPTIVPSALRLGVNAAASTSFIGVRCVYDAGGEQ